MPVTGSAKCAQVRLFKSATIPRRTQSGTCVSPGTRACAVCDEKREEVNRPELVRQVWRCDSESDRLSPDRGLLWLIAVGSSTASNRQGSPARAHDGVATASSNRMDQLSNSKCPFGKPV